jgi:hypothetical protein
MAADIIQANTVVILMSLNRRLLEQAQMKIEKMTTVLLHSIPGWDTSKMATVN